MTHEAIAVYVGGVLKPVSPLPLADGDRVRVIVVAPALLDSEPSTTENDDYDILEALNANRLAEGARPLIPPMEGR